MLNRIEVRETVPIRQIDEGIVGRPLQADAARVLQDRIDRCVTAGDRGCYIGSEGKGLSRLVDSTLATRIDHGCGWIRANGGRGAPPAPG